MRQALTALGACLALALPTAARAGVFDSFGYDPRGVGMGGTQTAAADDYTASYFNPALLVLQEKFSFGYGFNWSQPQMNVRALDGNRASQLQLSQPPSSFNGWTLGVLFPLGGKVSNRLALGVGLYLPSSNVLRTEATDPRAPAWYFYQSGPERIVVSASAGVRITDWLSIGGGAQILGALVGGFDFDLNLFSKQFEGRAMRADLETRVAPLAGLALDFKPIGLRFGFSFRGAIQSDYRLPTTFNLSDVGVIELVMEGVTHYSPDTYSLGVQYRLGSLVGTAELRYARWSTAPDPSTKVTLNVDGEALESLGLSEQFDIEGASGPPGFLDTLATHLGAEYWIVDGRFALRAGYSFRPTPVPLQRADSNILDGDTHGVSLGVGFSFDDPLEIFSHPIHIEAAAQRLVVPERQAQKEPEDPVPSYTYGGAVNELTFAVRYVF